MEESLLLELAALGTCLHEVTGIAVAWYDAESAARIEGPAAADTPERHGLVEPDLAEAVALLEPKEAAGPSVTERARAVHCATVDQLQYLVLPFPSGDFPVLVLGPFLTVPVDGAFVASLLARHRLPPESRPDLANYLSSLPLVSSTASRHLARVAAALLASGGGPVSLIPLSSGAEEGPEIQPISAPDLDRASIEARYAIERRLRHALARGDLAAFEAGLKGFLGIGDLPDRFVDNPLRSAKSLGVVANTFLRLAAGDAGVHPLRLHSVSEGFAIAIERAASTTELEALSEEMVRTYLGLVAGLERRASGTPLAPVLDYIDFHLAEDLSLSALASRFGLSPAGLSNRFRRILGMTASEYVNGRRVDEAAWYLGNSALSVKEIAALVGYADPAWFSRQFGALKGKSPLAWRRQGG